VTVLASGFYPIPDGRSFRSVKNKGVHIKFFPFLKFFYYAIYKTFFSPVVFKLTEQSTPLTKLLPIFYFSHFLKLTINKTSPKTGKEPKGTGG